MRTSESPGSHPAKRQSRWAAAARTGSARSRLPRSSAIHVDRRYQTSHAARDSSVSTRETCFQRPIPARNSGGSGQTSWEQSPAKPLRLQLLRSDSKRWGRPSARRFARAELAESRGRRMGTRSAYSFRRTCQAHRHRMPDRPSANRPLPSDRSPARSGPERCCATMRGIRPIPLW